MTDLTALGFQASWRKRLLALGHFVLVLGIGCAMPPPAPVTSPAAAASDEGCKDDKDCKGGRVCEKGACVSPSGMTADVKGRIDDGEVTLDLLRAAVDAEDCYEFRGLEHALKQLSDSAGYRTKLMAHLVDSDEKAKEPVSAFGEWLLLVERRSQICKSGAAREQLLAVSSDTGAFVDERIVDKAVKETDCAVLSSINGLGLWPFESQFVGEVANRDFTKAEVTRRLWLDTIETFTKECGKRLSRREVIEVDAVSDKLRRIVGLDDELLIGLRSKLMAAMEQGNAEAVRSYLASVTEREKALDSRNSAALEAKMKTIQADFEKARAEAKASATAAATPAKGSKKPQPAAATQPGAKPAEQIRDAVETTKAAVEAVDVARSLFGF